ncbi:branched-chain amino acid transport system ATP-binding protein [Rhizobium sp. SG_E_25_P2]|uniref:ABC transporter ATP-binding protein n=1 Tax=Rhizobium sp. SG_E_25_P2 TaxID=2879942 RepID=UPI00247495C3|nr:ABC transporter ATP-binding protein [Rhizobium sp. SG_E_25_P2]MDH6266032.1 branched-chain amino acid transport system ATP-binding protein [Rhizobium sp. SG_E_25_P2]
MKLIEVERLEAFYGDMQALFGVSLGLAEKECLALVGANGAGKSTLLRCLVGLNQRVRGAIRFDGKDIVGIAAEKIARSGIAMVPEGRMLFAELTVEENLTMGMLTKRTGNWTLPRVYELFPILAERRKQMAITLSGGQQQMVAIGRGLLSNPRVMLCDEISLGLAPVVVGQIYDSFRIIRAEGMSLVVVEQDINRALSVSDRLICLLKGQVTLEARSADVDMTRLTAAYFGE